MQIVRRIDPNASEVFAWFRDPAGNVLGIYQQAGLAEVEAGTPASPVFRTASGHVAGLRSRSSLAVAGFLGPLGGSKPGRLLCQHVPETQAGPPRRSGARVRAAGRRAP